MIPKCKEKIEQVKLKNFKVQIDVTSDNYKYINNQTTYTANYDLTSNANYPKNVIAILSAQGYLLTNGNNRATVIPNIDYPTSRVQVFAPIAGIYDCRILILYKE